MRPLLATGPTCRPRLSSAVVVERTAAAVAPKAAPKVPGRRYRRNSGEPGVETAVTNLARAAGSRGRRATSSSTVCDPGTWPRNAAVAGTRGVEPIRTNRPRTRGSPAVVPGDVAELASVADPGIRPGTPQHPWPRAGRVRHDDPVGKAPPVSLCPLRASTGLPFMAAVSLRA